MIVMVSVQAVLLYSIYYPLGGLVPVCVPSVQLIMIVMVSVQAVLYLI